MDKDKEIEVVAPVPTSREPSFSLRPRNLSEAMEFAKLIADSELVPREYRGKPGNVLIAVQMGAEVGLAPMQAIQNIAVINGRPTMWGDACLAVVQASGLLEYIREVDDGQVASCTVKRVGYPDPTVRIFGMEDARRAGLAGKPGPWTQYPARMRQQRARGFALRDGFADVLRGLITREEAEDIPTSEPRNVTPTPAPAPDMMPRRVTASTPPVKAPEPAPAPAEVAPAPQMESSIITFEINGREYRSHGITREQMLETFRLAPVIDKMEGKGSAARILHEDFAPAKTRLDLTEDLGEAYIRRLKLAIGEPLEDQCQATD